MALDMKYGEKITEGFQRECLAELLAQCTVPQQQLFAKMYPSGVPSSRLPWAITQCNNTLCKNKSEAYVKAGKP